MLENGWEAHAFHYDRAETDCAGGARYVQHSPRYSKWVGVELCSPTRYKIFLGETRNGVFHEITDWAGGGQDHCELVNSDFTLPNEDDITSGGCPNCSYAIGGFNEVGPVPVYDRGHFGTAFSLIAWPEYNHYTARWYACGVAIP